MENLVAYFEYFIYLIGHLINRGVKYQNRDIKYNLPFLVHSDEIFQCFSLVVQKILC